MHLVFAAITLNIFGLMTPALDPLRNAYAQIAPNPLSKAQPKAKREPYDRPTWAKAGARRSYWDSGGGCEGMLRNGLTDNVE